MQQQTITAAPAVPVSPLPVPGKRSFSGGVRGWAGDRPLSASDLVDREICAVTRQAANLPAVTPCPCPAAGACPLAD